MTLVYFLLPAYNEEENLPHLFAAIADSMTYFHVVLVNDGSQDRTREIAQEFAEEMPMTVINHDENKGLGCALKTGIFHIVEEGEGDAVVVTMDSDLTHNPQMVPYMVRELDNGYDVVVASRYAPGGEQRNLPLSRRILSWGINLLIRMKGSTVKDNTSGFRCIRLSALKRAVDKFGDELINTREFTSTVLILLRLLSVGVRTKEVPIILDYELKRGASKMKVGRTIRAYLRLLRST
ncbi:MAG: glycosyltransferase [Candidatus Thorarchaeota archaeon]